MAVLIVSAAGLQAPVMASASNPTNAQYKDAVNQVESAVNGGGNGPSGGSQNAVASETQSSTGLQKEVVGGLPFTGLDLVALLAVAFSLVSVGVALRRLSATPRRHL